MNLLDITKARGEVKRRFLNRLDKVLVAHDRLVLQARQCPVRVADFRYQEETFHFHHADAVKAEIAGLIDVDTLLYEVGVDRVVFAWPVRAPVAIGQICSSLDECFYLS